MKIRLQSNKMLKKQNPNVNVVVVLISSFVDTFHRARGRVVRGARNPDRSGGGVCRRRPRAFLTGGAETLFKKRFKNSFEKRKQQKMVSSPRHQRQREEPENIDSVERLEKHNASYVGQSADGYKNDRFGPDEIDVLVER